MVHQARREEIKRQYRSWRALRGLTQDAVTAEARRIYPEFGTGRFWRIENGEDFPSPSERKALAAVLHVNEADLPTEQAAVPAGRGR